MTESGMCPTTNPLPPGKYSGYATVLAGWRWKLIRSVHVRGRRTCPMGHLDGSRQPSGYHLVRGFQSPLPTKPVHSAFENGSREEKIARGSDPARTPWTTDAPRSPQTDRTNDGDAINGVAKASCRCPDLLPLNYLRPNPNGYETGDLLPPHLVVTRMCTGARLDISWREWEVSWDVEQKTCCWVGLPVSDPELDLGIKNLRNSRDIETRDLVGNPYE